jgi:hypothetical protein
MKKYLFALLAIAFFYGCQKTSSTETEQAEEVTVTYASYGAEITADEVNDVMKLDEIMQGQDSIEVKLTGNIEKTCKMKGCWMTINTGDSSTMRVTFKDYGFFVPKDSVGGRTAIFEGKAFKTVTSIEMLKHYAQDEGKSAEEIEAITEPKEEFTFVATGVLIEEEADSE